MGPQNVLDFWFTELGPSQWFLANPKLDELIKVKFSDLLKSASKGELYHWRNSTLGRLAEIIVLDQFSRNIYRGQPDAFASDGMALLLAQEMVVLGLDKEIPIHMRPFVYMPYMHSESRSIHEEAEKLFSAPGMEKNFQYEMDHKKTIDRFGRFPHRNAVLHRLSTYKEIEFMKNKRLENF